MPLQREFKGLADHTGLYQAGKLPIDLSPALSPVFSAEDFVNPPEIIRFLATITATGQQASAAVVPEGELHRVRWIGLEVDPGASATTVFHPVIFHLDAFFGLQDYTVISMPAGRVHHAGIYLGEMPLVLSPGMGVAWFCENYAGAGNVDCRGLYQYQRIGI